MSLQQLVVQLVIAHSILLVQTKKKLTLYFVITHSALCRHVVSNLSSSGPWLSLLFILQSCTRESFVSPAYKRFYYL
jgi:hypothetical protein